MLKAKPRFLKKLTNYLQYLKIPKKKKPTGNLKIKIYNVTVEFSTNFHFREKKKIFRWATGFAYIDMRPHLEDVRGNSPRR